MSVVISGFEPFNGESLNPSWEVARHLEGKMVDNHPLVAVRLPSVFGEAVECLWGAVAHLQPAAILCLGEAGGRSAISVERVAINLEDARIPDNRGQQPRDRPVIPDGPAAYFATLPVRAIVERLTGAGIPAELSLSAGAFVCNHTLYGLLHRLGAQSPVRAGFLHVPYLPEQAARHPGKPSMALATMVEGVRLAAAVTLAGA